MRLTARIRLTLTTTAFAVLVATASTFAGQGDPPTPSADSSQPRSGGRDPVIHVPAVHAGRALVREPKGTPQLPATALARLDIPPTALLAYQRAAAVMAQADRSCRLSWTLLAAIGRVESDHGRYGGALLQADGVSSPLIRGVELDGRGRFARVADTDGGVLDGDRTWDRAVGPMQFLPATWSVVAVDGDGDGIRSPDDLDDAALAAGVFLCSGSADLGTAAGRAAAVLRYNPSRAYVASVLGVEHAYRTGDYTLQGEAAAVGPVHVVVNAPAPARPSSRPTDHRTTAEGAREGAGQQSSADAGTRTPGHGAANGPGTGSEAGSATAHPSAGPQHHSSSGGRTSGGAGAAAAPGWHGPTSPDPTDPSTPAGPRTPADPGTPAEPSTPADPSTPGDPSTPADPEPTSPSTDPSPEPVTLSGTLLRCGTEPQQLCLDDTLLDVGDAAFVETPAAADLDGDGTVESNAEELDGLVGTPVDLEVLPGTSPALVVSVNGAAYRTP